MLNPLSFRRSITEQTEAPSFVGGLYPRKQVSLLASAAGSGKTWVVLKQALDLSIGGHVFLSPESMSEPAKSLIFCGEAGIEIMVDRKRRLDQIYNEESISLYCLQDLLAQDVNMCLDEPQGRRNFNAIITAEQPDIIFVDTLISFRSDDENASKETGRLLSALRKMADKHNCAIVIVHHVRKRKLKEQALQANQDEIIGSSAFVRLSAVCYMLQASQDERYVNFFCVKSWYAKPKPKNFCIDGDGAFYVRLREVEFDTTREPTEAELYITKLQVGSVITSRDIVRECGCSFTTAYTHIMRAVDKGLLKLVGNQNRVNHYVKLSLDTPDPA